MAPEAEGSADAPSDQSDSAREDMNGDEMGVVVYIALTVAIFALLGWMQKLVERL